MKIQKATKKDLSSIIEMVKELNIYDFKYDTVRFDPKYPGSRSERSKLINRFDNKNNYYVLLP